MSWPLVSGLLFGWVTLSTALNLSELSFFHCEVRCLITVRFLTSQSFHGLGPTESSDSEEHVSWKQPWGSSLPAHS